MPEQPDKQTFGTHLNGGLSTCQNCMPQRQKRRPCDVCTRRFTRTHRPDADYILGCSHAKFTNLVHCFLPSLVMHIHEEASLVRFASDHILQWYAREITLWMTCSRGMPFMAVKVYEFLPHRKELRVQIQYRTDSTTRQRISVKRESPALGMKRIIHDEQKTYDDYVSAIVDHHLDTFANVCWADDDDDFAPQLFRLTMSVRSKAQDEVCIVYFFY